MAAVPALISGMGTDRFGLLTIIWMGVGYFRLFDLGLGRTLSKLVSERLGTNDTTDLPGLIWTALTLLTARGVIGGLTLYATSGSIVTGLLNVDASISGEAITAFRILALGIPVVVATVALVGLLEPYQRFAAITLVRIPLGVLTFGGRLVVVSSRSASCGRLRHSCVSRIVALVAYFNPASRAHGELREPARLRRCPVRPLVSFGGWLTVTNWRGLEPPRHLTIFSWEAFAGMLHEVGFCELRRRYRHEMYLHLSTASRAIRDGKDLYVHRETSLGDRWRAAAYMTARSSGPRSEFIHLTAFQARCCAVTAPRISIAMATYNGGSNVMEQLESLLAQERLLDELVVSDDGSSDATVELVEPFGARAPFDVTVTRNERNLGFAANSAGAPSRAALKVAASGRYGYFSGWRSLVGPRPLRRRSRWLVEERRHSCYRRSRHRAF